MKKKYLIVIADYYKDISKGLLSSAKSILPKSILITQPRAKKASYFLIFFEIVTGISKTPGTLIIFIKLDLGNMLLALLSKPFDMSL